MGQPVVACHVVTDIETDGPDPGPNSMRRYAQWLSSLPWPRVFASHPLFFGAGIDLPSFIARRMGMDYAACERRAYPASWFEGYEHTHRAIDDALGCAAVLKHVLTFPEEPRP